MGIESSHALNCLLKKTVICAHKNCYLSVPTSATPALLRTCIFQTTMLTIHLLYLLSYIYLLFFWVSCQIKKKKLTAFDGGRKEKEGESLMY